MQRMAMSRPRRYVSERHSSSVGYPVMMRVLSAGSTVHTQCRPQLTVSDTTEWFEQDEYAEEQQRGIPAIPA
jgi:hypothetical protein